MRKADFTYEIKDNIVRIVDLNLGNVSVTNDAENVLTTIQKETDIRHLRVIARDSFGDLDELFPSWEGNTCVNVTF